MKSQKLEAGSSPSRKVTTKVRKIRSLGTMNATMIKMSVYNSATHTTKVTSEELPVIELFPLIFPRLQTATLHLVY